MFTACTTDYPEITITYTFRGEDYAVDYTLSREATPRTVQHFIDLADAGYYDGTCIHDYASDGIFLYGGGYTIEDGELVQKDYFAEVKALEKAGTEFDQSVYLTDETAQNKAGDALYTVYGEFSNNGYIYDGSRGYSHRTGALVMYYNYDTDETQFNYKGVTIQRNDNDEYQDNNSYPYNSATSLFYTFTGENRSDLDQYYCVFGMASDYETQMTGENGLLTAINAYKDTLGEGESFTTEWTQRRLDQYDHYPMDEAYLGEYSSAVYSFFEDIRTSGRERVYNTPLAEGAQIIIKSVVVNKY